MFSRDPRSATLHAANYALALEDGEFGDRSTARMAPGAVFVALTEYRARRRAAARTAVCTPRAGLRLPLDPARFSGRALAHPRPGQAGAQQFFTLRRPAVLPVRRRRRRSRASAGGRSTRADHVLRALRVGAAARSELPARRCSGRVVSSAAARTA